MAEPSGNGEYNFQNLLIMSIYKVHNLHEQRNGNWKKYWEDATNLAADHCHKVGCTSTLNIDGAHVQLDTPNDNRWWIVPLCHKCNCNFGAHFYVNGPLVSVVDPKVILR